MNARPAAVAVREVRRKQRKVTRKDPLSRALAAAGGAAVVLEPSPAR